MSGNQLLCFRPAAYNGIKTILLAMLGFSLVDFLYL